MRDSVRGKAREKGVRAVPDRLGVVSDGESDPSHSRRFRSADDVIPVPPAPECASDRAAPAAGS